MWHMGGGLIHRGFALQQVIGGGCHLDRPTVDALEAAFDSVHVLGVVDSQLIPVVYGTAHKK